LAATVMMMGCGCLGHAETALNFSSFAGLITVGQSVGGSVK
jgi:hypothetical protein